MHWLCISQVNLKYDIFLKGKKNTNYYKNKNRKSHNAAVISTHISSDWSFKRSVYFYSGKSALHMKANNFPNSLQVQKVLQANDVWRWYTSPGGRLGLIRKTKQSSVINIQSQCLAIWELLHCLLEVFWKAFHVVYVPRNTEIKSKH